MFKALIDKNTCIGCTRCIPACPVDAIIGAKKHLHTVLNEACIGCHLCVDPCPVDCITMVPIEMDLSTKKQIGLDAKERYKARQIRLSKNAQKQLPVFQSPEIKKQKIQSEIEQALLRKKAL